MPDLIQGSRYTDGTFPSSHSEFSKGRKIARSEGCKVARVAWVPKFQSSKVPDVSQRLKLETFLHKFVNAEPPVKWKCRVSFLAALTTGLSDT
ncbi:predicted protein [Sclerotinia sclerotiorum 1980 UF-70]|uniref:Uncharacterized protein n=1 Tax=Sclerotinia sclerotiorum (strain ATCC 18683 / 1980 / Ss-1) TaxID=665079 RepID=A7EFD2_SCLS1|nr:predicted protein [Sclerotinia sclerotiorum 1980 UF-70]EDO01548.1 predicted protein [Sclerotinia sclerotiorum 1980 UF-70]